MTDMDRDFVNALAGYEVSETEAQKFFEDFNDWLDHYFFETENREYMV